jgi:hypothetical protein
MEPLTIAEGTKHAITVWDARWDYPWARQSIGRAPGAPRCIFVHHTATARRCRTAKDEWAAMLATAESAPFRLPYNFLIFPTASQRIYYLNDVDMAWPHTLNHNDCTAVCAWGNHHLVDAPTRMVQRMRRLILALQTMWGETLPVLAHRHVAGTACPGDRLFRALADRHVFDGGERWLRGEW